jgi:hypothetical protein
MTRKELTLLFGGVLATLACSSSQPPESNMATARPADGAGPEAPAYASAAPVAPPASAASSTSTPGTPTVPGSQSPPLRKFPPAAIEPPHARSAAEGDGRWTPYVSAGQPVDPAPAFAITRIHPHEASRFIEVTLVAIDLQKARVEFMPGTEDLGGAKVPFAAGLVPQAERSRLLAVFNGGFQPRHGRWGMKLGETTVVPARTEGCTLALYADGSVRLGSWPKLPTADAAGLRAFRQTPPCLVEDGVVHPDLLAGRDKAWKGNTSGIVTRRRSAVGLDETGTLLFYALGVEASPRLLAEALRVAGARDAAELDINWNWTRFFLYERGPDGKPRFASALAPGEHAKSTYVERASERDFFYVLER